MSDKQISPWEQIKAGLTARAPFQQSWQVRLNDPTGRQALELRFSFLVSRNGFRRLADVIAISFQRQPGRETAKVALKQSLDPASFEILPEGGFRLGSCEFTPRRTKGSLQAKGQVIHWDLQDTQKAASGFSLIPNALRQSAISRSTLESVQADGTFAGTSSLNGQAFEWQDAPGIVSHQSGPLTGHSWIWAHCNRFQTEQGIPVPFVFEGLTLRGHLLGMLPSPRFSSFHFRFKGQSYEFHSLRDWVRIQSKYSLNEWHFQAERGDLLFRGHAKVENKDFAGMGLEDTNGSLLYCATSKLSDLDIHVYRRGKLESALRADKSAAIEITSRRKNPYVPLLV